MSARSRQHASTQQATVAVVENDASLLKSLNRLLVVSGYRTELYASAEQVLSSIAGSRATCLIVDCELGNCSGPDVVRRIAAAGLSFPVVFMSGCDDSRICKLATDVGCAALLKKPFSADELLHSIATAVRGARLESTEVPLA